MAEIVVSIKKANVTYEHHTSFTCHNLLKTIYHLFKLKKNIYSRAILINKQILNRQSLNWVLVIHLLR